MDFDGLEEGFITIVGQAQYTYNELPVVEFQLTFTNNFADINQDKHIPAENSNHPNAYKSLLKDSRDPT